MKEHCKTCKWYDPWADLGSYPKTAPYFDGWCEFTGDEVDDAENLTCFNWELNEEDEDE